MPATAAHQQQLSRKVPKSPAYEVSVAHQFPRSFWPTSESRVSQSFIEPDTEQLVPQVKPEVLDQQPFPRTAEHSTGQAPNAARLFHNPLCNLPCSRQQAIERQHLVNQPDLLGRLPVDLLAAVEVLSGALPT